MGVRRAMTHYRGEPDPFKGDTPNQRVRDMAKEAVDALFGAENAPQSIPTPPTLSVRESILLNSKVIPNIVDRVAELWWVPRN